MSHLPDFVVLGQGKAGTSLMHRVLGENPAVCVSQPKELHFFNSSYDRGREWYARHFRPASDQVRRIGDISPSYLREEAVQRIADTLGTEIQIVFVLRRPVEQSYSRYLQNICAQGRGAGFDRVLANLPKRLDNQFRALRLCYDLFGADRILPLFYETDITTFAFEARLLGFLGLPPAEFSAPFRSGPRINSGVMPRYVYAGENPLEIREDGESYVLPARHLAFCAQPRNSRVLPDISRQAAAELMEQQAGWTREISREVYARAQEEAVLPAAARLEEAFGFDMSHWRGAPRALSYAPAPHGSPRADACKSPRKSIGKSTGKSIGKSTGSGPCPVRRRLPQIAACLATAGAGLCQQPQGRLFLHQADASAERAGRPALHAPGVGPYP